MRCVVLQYICQHPRFVCVISSDAERQERSSFLLCELLLPLLPLIWKVSLWKASYAKGIYVGETTLDVSSILAPSTNSRDRDPQYTRANRFLQRSGRKPRAPLR